VAASSRLSKPESGGFVGCASNCWLVFAARPRGCQVHAAANKQDAVEGQARLGAGNELIAIAYA